MHSIVLEELRSHVKRGARFGFGPISTSHIDEIFNFFAHSEVAQFQNSVFIEQDVGWFQVGINYRVLVKV